MRGEHPPHKQSEHGLGCFPEDACPHAKEEDPSLPERTQSQRRTVHELLEMPFYHPVLEEGIRTALKDLEHRLRLPETIAGCKELAEAS